MSIEGIPLILKTSLEVLLQENVISSWQIKGGPKYSQVNIRFRSSTIDMPIVTEEVQYRRAPPSRINRDRERAMDRGYGRIHRESQTDEDTFPDMSAGENLQISTYEFTPHQHQSASIGEGSSVNPSLLLPNDQCSQPSGTDLSKTGANLIDPDQDHNNIDQGSTSSDLVSCQNKQHVFDQIYAKFEDGMDGNAKADDQEVNEDGTYTCDGCGAMMSGSPGSTWYRCTDCKDIDLCLNCYHKGVHSQHDGQISKFICPPDMDSCGYCDACGCSFGDDYNRGIWQCSMCEDYFLCSECHTWQSYHKKHSKHFNCLTMEDFRKL